VSDINNATEVKADEKPVKSGKSGKSKKSVKSDKKAEKKAKRAAKRAAKLAKQATPPETSTKSAKPAKPKTKKTIPILTGKFVGNSNGFGFVEPNEPYEPDIFVSIENKNGAIHGDTVKYIITPPNFFDFDFDFDRPHREQGRIVEIVKRGMSVIGGVFRVRKKGKKRKGNLRTIGVAVPIDSRITQNFEVSQSAIKRLGLVSGHMIDFRVLISGKVQVLGVFGHESDPGMDILSAIRQSGVPYKFSDEVLAEADALPETVTASDFADRVDLRDWKIITIDGSDTKDIDDAISLKILPGGDFELGVHIADVSHYVRHGTALDKQAKLRGTSIYLADRVLPMLPPKLSNGICSLNPHVDRLAVSCIMQVDKNGTVTARRVTPSVIHSRRQFSYDEVAEILRDLEISEEISEKISAKEVDSERHEWREHFANMHKLAEILRNKREKRGALNFNIDEAKVILDEVGKPLTIELRQANAATSLIEEFMIVCNETIAEYSQKRAFVFRTHEPPSKDKLLKLAAFAKGLGHKLKISEKGVAAADIQTLIAQNNPALDMVILRSLKQAKYTQKNVGHFGLASECYCHFTSPIRRYPDLMVHRSLKNPIKRRGLTDLCDHCSQTERAAESLERDVLQLKKVQFMSKHIGKKFNGIVSGMTNWGFFVRLENTVEGVVLLRSLQDYYNFWEHGMTLIGQRYDKRITMGMEIAVQLVQVDEKNRRLTFTVKGF